MQRGRGRLVDNMLHSHFVHILAGVPHGRPLLGLLYTDQFDSGVVFDTSFDVIYHLGESLRSIERAQ